MHSAIGNDFRDTTAAAAKLCLLLEGYEGRDGEERKRALTKSIFPSFSNSIYFSMQILFPSCFMIAFKQLPCHYKTMRRKGKSFTYVCSMLN